MICKTYDYLSVMDLQQGQAGIVCENSPMNMTFIWNTGEVMDITVDNERYRLLKNEIIFLNSFTTVNSLSMETARMIRFNESHFCVLNGTEIGSTSQLLSGAVEVPIASVRENDLRSFEISWEIFCLEMQSRDTMQKYMFQAGLQRLLILFSRNLRQPTVRSEPVDCREDIVRKFNYLVEGHFLKHHDVGFYASKLNKSPKTLSNMFSALSDKTPMGIIHDRIMLHACRQIRHTAKPIKEIAYELGYEDIHTFSRFFKNKQGISPVNYRETTKGFPD